MYLGLHHQHSTHAHLIDDCVDIDEVFLLQLLREYVKGNERSRATDASAA